MLKKHGLNIALVAMAILIVVVGGVLVSLLTGTQAIVSDMLLHQSETSNLAFRQAFQEYQTQALERAEMIAASEDIITAVSNRDEAALLKSLKTFSTGMDLITLCDADGNVLVRAHSDKKGDSVLSQEAIVIALSTGTGISTIEPGTVIGISTRGSAAIKDESGQIIGALTCGHDLSQAKYIDAIKEKNNCEATFFVGDERMSTTLVDAQGNRVIGTKASDQVVEAVLTQKHDFHSRLELFGRMYEVYYSPMLVKDQAIGMLFTGVLVEDFVKQEQAMLVSIIIAAVLLLFVVFITAAVIRWITKKIHWYEEMLDSIPFPISVTDMNRNWTFINKPVEEMLNVKRVAMIGKPCSTWGAAICNTGHCGITCLEKGQAMTTFEQLGLDFQVDSAFLLDNKHRKVGHIEVVQDITERVKSQKAEAALVEKIREVSAAFVSASQNVANGASSLAHNTMEQSATVQQLSGAVSEISGKTKASSDLAIKAAELADTIKITAETGSVQMDKMTQAVEEIDLSSQSISKVMKVIDDIAFQTNILALNAAVEAARAGQHGKGFAVVADEVRNLAAKSAEAANDTSSLISNSMEKAKLGVNIAAETAASLKEIVSGIEASSQIINEIASASKEQTATLAEINRGIDQVAQNVQQNSATAEESAAASEEMSGQTAFLQQLIDNFHDSEPTNRDAVQKNISQSPVNSREPARQLRSDGFAFSGDSSKY